MLPDHFSAALNEEAAVPAGPSVDDHKLLLSVYSRKANVNPLWFSSLMDPASETELLRVLRSGKHIVALGGSDVISSGVWRAAAERDPRVLALITAFTNSCLRLSMLPDIGKRSIIVPILKKASEEC